LDTLVRNKKFHALDRNKKADYFQGKPAAISSHETA
jgi:hypothetical protein